MLWIISAGTDTFERGLIRTNSSTVSASKTTHVQANREELTETIDAPLLSSSSVFSLAPL